MHGQKKTLEMTLKKATKALESGKITQSEFDAHTTTESVTIAGTTLSHVHAIELSALEIENANLKARLERLKRIEFFAESYAAATGPLFEKCKIRQRHGITAFKHSTRLNVITKKQIEDADFTPAESKLAKFLSNAGNFYVGFMDSLDNWRAEVSAGSKEQER